jgi:hypothetical protein
MASKTKGGRDATQWAEYLAERAVREHIEIWDHPEVWGWCAAGVGEQDDEEAVWEAFLEALQPPQQLL